MRVEYVAALTLIAHVAVWRWSGFSKCSQALTRDHDSPVEPRARKDLQVRAAAAASTGKLCGGSGPLLRLAGLAWDISLRHGIRVPVLWGVHHRMVHRRPRP